MLSFWLYSKNKITKSLKYCHFNILDLQMAYIHIRWLRLGDLWIPRNQKKQWLLLEGMASTKRNAQGGDFPLGQMSRGQFSRYNFPRGQLSLGAIVRGAIIQEGQFSSGEIVRGAGGGNYTWSNHSEGNFPRGQLSSRLIAQGAIIWGAIIQGAIVRGSVFHGENYTDTLSTYCTFLDQT